MCIYKSQEKGCGLDIKGQGVWGKPLPNSPALAQSSSGMTPLPAKGRSHSNGLSVESVGSPALDFMEKWGWTLAVFILKPKRRAAMSSCISCWLCWQWLFRITSHRDVSVAEWMPQSLGGGGESPSPWSRGGSTSCANSRTLHLWRYSMFFLSSPATALPKVWQAGAWHVGSSLFKDIFSLPDRAHE